MRSAMSRGVQVTAAWQPVAPASALDGGYERKVDMAGSNDNTAKGVCCGLDTPPKAVWG